MATKFTWTLEDEVRLGELRSGTLTNDEIGGISARVVS